MLNLHAPLTEEIISFGYMIKLQPPQKLHAVSKYLKQNPRLAEINGKPQMSKVRPKSHVEHCNNTKSDKGLLSLVNCFNMR